MNYTHHNYIAVHRNPLRSLGLGLLAATAMVALTGAPAAQAAAGDDAHVVTEQITLIPHVLSDDAVACPAGERAIGGGITAPSTQGDTYESVSGPLDETGTTAATDDGDVPRYWYSGVYNDTNQEQTHTLYAICSASSDATIQATEFKGAGNRISTPASATCPSGQRAISGGLSTTALKPQVGTIEASGPLDETGLTANTDDGDVARSWYASIRDFEDGTFTYKVFAICSATSQATIQATPLSLTNVQLGQETAACPAGQRALGGGIGTTGAGYGLLNSSAPGPSLSNGDVPTEWTASMFNTGGLQTYKVFAICDGTPTPTPTPTPDPTTPTGTPPLCAQTAATIVGTEGAETIQGTPGDDIIVALGGDDKILASGGNDVVCAGAGNDNLKGGGGTDLLFGEDGKDVSKGGPGRDSCYGGLGRDSNSCEKGRA